MPQWIGIASRAPSSAAASAARPGSMWPGPIVGPQPQIGSSATSTGASSAMPGEDVRVAGEVDRAAGALDHVAERLGAGAERQPARVVLGGDGAHRQRADLDLLARAHLDHVRRRPPCA